PAAVTSAASAADASPRRARGRMPQIMPYTPPMWRRSFLRAGLVWGGVAFLGGSRAIAEAFSGTRCTSEPLGELVRVLPVHGATARATPFGRIIGGTGLDARR